MPFLRTERRISREAARWVARLASDGGERDLPAFRTWYSADRRHAQAYDRVAAIWSAAGEVRRPVPEARAASSAGASTGALRFALAAGLIGAVALALVLLLGARWAPGAAPQQSLALASAVGEIRQVDLPDGSRVILDSGSRIEARFTAAERGLVLLEGRARFVVAHGTRPFIVRASSNEVVATGTVFDVSLLGGRLAVLLLDGSVQVRTGRQGAHRLAAGQKLIVAPGGPALIEPAGRGEAGWPSRMLEFEDTPLVEAIALVNRYSDAKVRLADEAAGNLRVSGAYRAGDVAGFARSLTAAFDLRLETPSEREFVLRRR